MNEARNYLVIGKKGSGKSATGWELVTEEHSRGRCAYMYGCPKIELLSLVPFPVTNLTQLNQLFHLQDAVCIVDEANIYFNSMEKKVNNELKELLQLSRQNNVCFIFIVHNSYVFNRGLFGHLDVKIIKEVVNGHWELERPHMKKLYEGVRVAGKGKAFVDSDTFKGYTTSNLPDWYSAKFSTMFRASKQPENIISALFKKFSK